MGTIDNVISQLQNGNTNLSQLIQAIKSVFPNISGQATSATSGAASALPATPAGYFTMNNPQTGQVVKVPFYNQ